MIYHMNKILIITVMVMLFFAIPVYAQNNPPATPSLQLPANNGYVNTVTPVMQWAVPADPEEDLCNFKFAFSNSSDMSGAITVDSSLDNAQFSPTPPLSPGMSSTCTYTVPASTYTQFSDGNTIYWTITANDGTVDGGTSTVWSYKIDTTNPSISSESATNDLGNPQLSPNGDGKGDSVTINYSISEDCNVTIGVYDATDTLVKTLVNNIQYGAGAQSSSWDGTNSANTTVPDGTYTIKIDAVDLASNPATQKTLTVTVDSVAPTMTLLVPAITNNPFSPDNNGIKDTTTLNWNLGENSNVKREIIDSTSTVVRDFGDLTLPGSGDKTILWDGKDNSANSLADGDYKFRLTATDPANNSTTLEATVTIDTTAPVVNPYAASRTPFSPQVNSTSIDYTTNEDSTVEIWIENINGQKIKTLLTPTPENGGSYSESWDGKDDSGTILGNGTYTYYIKTTDSSGNSSTVNGDVVIDTTNPSATIINVNPTIFSPNGDGKMDTTLITYNLTKTATVEVAVFNNSGIHQMTIENALKNPSNYDVSWDGRDKNSATVIDGTYGLRIFATDEAGNQSTMGTGEVTVDNTAPTITNLVLTPSTISPTLSPNFVDNLSISYTLSETSSVSIDIYDQTNTVVRNLISNVSKSDGNQTVQWDGRNNANVVVADGAYSIRIKAVDAASNESATIQDSVIVDNTAPVISSLSVSPDPFAPNGNGILDTTQLSYTLTDSSAQCTMEVDVYYGALKIRTLQSATLVNSGTNQISWDGKDDSGTYQNDGIYTFKLKATDDGYNDSTVESIDVEINKSAPVLSKVKFLDNRNGIDTDDTFEITFSTQIDDSSIIGSSVDTKFIIDGIGTFGSGAQITTGTSTNDKIIEVRMGNGAVKPATNSDKFSIITGAVKSLTGVDSTDTTQRLIEDGTPPVLSGDIIFKDVNNDGINKGDTLTLTFDEDVSLISSSVNGIKLYPSGSFGSGAIMQAGSLANQIIVILGSQPTLQVSGVYGVNAGATGLELVSGAETISDKSGNYAIPNPVGTPLDIKTEDNTGPKIVSAIWEDSNSGSTNGGLSSGDEIIVTFDKPIAVSGTSTADFKLPVSGNSFGTGASYAYKDTKSVIITLGTGLNMEIKGTYFLGNNEIGSPSGIDINGTATGITDIGGNSAVESYPVDIQSTDTTPPTILSGKLSGNMGNNYIDPTIDLVTIQAVVDDSSLKDGDVKLDLSDFGLSNSIDMTRLGNTTTFEYSTTLNNTSGTKTIKISAADYSGNSSEVYVFTAQTVEPAAILIGEVNPSTVQKSSGTQLFRVHIKPTFESYSKGIDEVRVYIPVNNSDPAAGYQYGSSLEVLIGGVIQSTDKYSATFSNSYLNIDFTNRITSAISNPLIELRFALVVPDVTDSPTGKTFTIQVREDEFAATYYQTATAGNGDGISTNNDSMKVVVNDLNIESVSTTLDFSSFLWRVNFKVKFNYELDTSNMPKVSFLPQNSSTIKEEIPIQNVDFYNVVDSGVTKTVYTGYARIPVDNPDYRNNYTIFFRTFRDKDGTLIAEVKKENNEMATGFIITAFENPFDNKDIIITIKSTTGVVQPFSVEVEQPGDIPVTIPPSTIQTYRQLLFQTVYRLDPNYPGQTTIKVKTISINPSPLARLNLFMEKTNEDGGLTMEFKDIKAKLVIPQGGMEKNKVCMIIPNIPGLTLDKSGLKTRVKNSQLTSIKPDINIVSRSPFKKNGKFYLSIADIPENERKGLFFGEYEKDRIKYLESEIYKDKISCEISKNMTIGLFRDDIAPVIKLISNKNDILLEVKDGGSGLRKNGVRADFGSIVLSGVHIKDDLYLIKTGGIIKDGIYDVKLSATDNCGNSSSPMRFPLSIVPDKRIDRVEVFPNPATTMATFRYKLGKNCSRVNLKIYDGGGRIVINRDLPGTFASPVAYNEIWNLRNKNGRLVSNGTYFYKLRVFDGDVVSTKRGKFSILR